MTCERMLSRDAIVKTLTDALEPLDYVHALWEGGAVALNRVDKWSDIDAYLIVDEGKISDAFLAVEKALQSLSPIKQKYEVQQLPWPGVSQAFYRLEDASEYLLVDLAILTVNSPEKFLEPKVHGNAVFYFNKNDVIKLPLLDKSALVDKLQKRIERLRARFEMFNNFVQKEINRGNYLEALEFYHALTLASLVEALRTRYTPIHHDFKIRHIHYELPQKIVEQLKSLYFIGDKDDLQAKYREATDWFLETISKIDQMGIERLVEES